MAANEKAETSHLPKKEDESKSGDSSDKGKNTTERVGDISNFLFAVFS